MSLLFCLLGSGSKGNAIFVKAGAQGLLIDAGLSARQITLRLEAAGFAAHDVTTIVVTHEHRDHLAGVDVLARRHRLTVTSTPATWSAAPSMPGVRHQPLDAGRSFTVGGLSLTPFSIPHDARDPVGLVVAAGGVRLGVCTDLGKPTGLVRQRLAGCQALILEANHDPGLLARGPYPEWLKQRVRGAHGHLSNQDAAGLLGELCHPGLGQVVLAHLSEKNNRPELALAAAREALAAHGSAAGLCAARQDAPSPVFRLE
ncbi:MAG: MBL fold metallo-hydrolase [Deltaproteobacteria bacterium]|nr:MBL fold metallo-hydrolase [Deltaproteobacteria bacterium]